MITDVFARSDLGPVASAIAAVVASVLPVLLAVSCFLRARKRRRLAASEAAMLEHSQDRGSALAEGEILLSGVVEHAPDHDVAVRVDVTQHGTESESSGSWSYRWEEVDREIIVKPFYVRLADGTRVRVLAPSNVEVADALDRKVLISNTERVLSAELVPGEAIHAHGRLERGENVVPHREAGYRDAPREWQLVPSNGRMLLSSEPLGLGMSKRAAFHRRYARRAVFVFVVLQLSLANFWVRTFSSDEPVEIVKKEHRVEEDSDGDPVDRYYVIIGLDRALAEVDIDSDDFARLPATGKIAIRRGAFGWELGGGGALFFLHALAAVLFAFAIHIAYAIARPATRPWYRRRVAHSGSGRLPGS